VCSFRLESLGAQQEYVVVDSVKYQSVRSGLCCNIHHMSAEQYMPLQEDWTFTRFLTLRTSGQLVQKAQVLI
jgi:hypothetical protein